MCAVPVRAPPREILYALLSLSCLAGPFRIYSFLTTPSLLLPLHVWDPTLSSFPRIKNPTQYSPLLTPHPASPYLHTIDLAPSRSWGRYIFGHLLVPKKLPDPKLLPQHTPRPGRTELEHSSALCVLSVSDPGFHLQHTSPEDTGAGATLHLTFTQPRVETRQIIFRQSLLMCPKLASNSLSMTLNF